jgi:hypothetical protein
MCTINCPYFVFTLSICIAIHSVHSKDFILFTHFCPIVHTRLLLIIFVIVHYSDTGNVFQVF